jgi:hypothetical protein
MMKVRNYSLAVMLAAFAVAAAPALAQSPREGGSPTGGGGDRGGGGGAGNSGSAGGGGSVATASGGGGGSTSSAGGASFSSPSGVSATSPNISFGERGVRQSAPEHRAEFAARSSSSANSDGQARPRTAAGSGESGGSGDRAVPRGEAAGGRDRSSAGENSGARTRMSPPARETASSSEANPNNASGAREVPSWSRPRGDNPTTGVAVPRTGAPPDRDNRRGGGRYYDPYYYGYPGYGFGYYNYYYPYTYGLGYGLYSGLGWNPYFGDPWDPYTSGYGGSGGYSSGVYNTVAHGNLKLKVKPRNAKVYVDGFYVGLVDEFDGAFQKLALNGGRHKVEVRAEGYETAEFDVLITPDQTVTFQGELKRIQ